MTLADRISLLLRSWGLLGAAHQLKYRYARTRHRGRNRRFVETHPEVALPPDYLMYEAHGIDYSSYFHGGKRTASELVQVLGAQKNLRGAKVLEWGCGPGRLIRHLPALLGPEAELHGTDYNEQSIAWCKAHLPGIQFHRNELYPPLPFAEGSFDFVYNYSIFTHLSEALHHAWRDELLRVLRPGGLLMCTLQGPSYRYRLRPAEQLRFDAGELVVWDKAKEGHRSFAAFHPPDWVRTFFAPHALLAYYEGSRGEQDKWLFRKEG